MNPALKVAAGVAGGYLLGRHRKLRYAVGFGAALLGKRIDLNPSRLVLTGVRSLRELPEVMELGETVRGELATSGRRAAATLMTNRLDSLSDSLRERSSAFESGARTGAGNDDQHEQPQDDVYPDEQPSESGQREHERVASGRAGGGSQTRDENRRPRRHVDDDEPDDLRDDDEPDDLRDERDQPDDDEPDDLRDERDQPDDDEPDEPAEPRRTVVRRRAGTKA